MRRYAARARVALDELPFDRGGVAGDPWFKPFIRDAHGIFEGAGGRGKVTWNEHDQRYEGPFFAFLKAILERLPPELRRSDGALGKAIFRALTPSV